MIISCIGQCNGRYGIGVITAAVRGMKQEKLARYRLYNNTCYGKMPDVSDLWVKQMIYHLVLEGYLAQTNSESKEKPKYRSFYLCRNNSVPMAKSDDIAMSHKAREALLSPVWGMSVT